MKVKNIRYSDLPKTGISSPKTHHLDAVDDAMRTIAATKTEVASEIRKYHKDHRERLALDLGLVGNGSGQKVLEVGAHPGILTFALSRLGFDVEAVDLHPERLEGLGLRTTGCNIEEMQLPFSDETFDVVLLNEVFEHLRIDLIFTLGELFRVLKPGGVLHLSTPNLRSLRGMKSLLIDGRGAWCLPNVYDNWAGLHSAMPRAGHIREYTARDVVEFLEKMGFHCEKILFRGGGGSFIGRITLSFIPTWRPFFSIISRRPIHPPQQN